MISQRPPRQHSSLGSSGNGELRDSAGASSATTHGRGGLQKGITISASAQNLTNRANYSGFSGVMTSQYFLQATSVSNPRQIDLSIRFNF